MWQSGVSYYNSVQHLPRASPVNIPADMILSCLSASSENSSAAQRFEPMDTGGTAEGIHCSINMHAKSRISSPADLEMYRCREESPAWFTSASFNAALAAMHSQDMTAAAVLFRASGSFIEAFSVPTAQLLMTQMVRANQGLRSHSQR
jgi:hypothetical protein